MGGFGSTPGASRHPRQRGIFFAAPLSLCPRQRGIFIAESAAAAIYYPPPEGAVPTKEGPGEDHAPYCLINL
jgi:hypothetical protein